ncbi:hypothetical protein PVAP13_9NG678414 [Panicum virgatum]|uniref:Uncharacterized protein n=1 Tax=Panicum virgatum TaxID=38727 RepID=A0A8T0N0E2_PANVG|nr:hypothetical protein PVAP13_9NG678414 [Panicum virgatum]
MILPNMMMLLLLMMMTILWIKNRKKIRTISASGDFHAFCSSQFMNLCVFKCSNKILTNLCAIWGL